MRRRQSDENAKQKLSQQINYLLGKVSEIDKIEGEFERPLWTYIEKVVTKKIERKDEMLYDFKKLSPREIDCLLAEKNELVGILGLPSFIKERESIEKEIDELKQKRGKIGIELD